VTVLWHQEAPGPAAGAAARVGFRTTRLRPGWLGVGVLVVAGALVTGVAVGPVSLPFGEVVRELLWFDSSLTDTQRDILWQLRLPRVVLGLLVGGTLAIAGASYQGAFRNPLADPYLLGAAAGAGLGVTVVIVAASGGTTTPVGAPLAAFVGALLAVLLTYLVGAAGSARASSASLLLAGVAVATFLTAVQTYVQQRNSDTIRQVYSWILGRLSTAGWGEVWLVLPYIAVAAVALLLHRRALDVLAVGDDEATALGLDARRVRLGVVVAASLGTAAAVSVSGLIAFVGIIVPHTVRLLVGGSNRVILPLSLLFGGIFLVVCDLVARTIADPAEVPIGVVTAFFGAPFFVVVLRTSKR
jgi:iron complex transport system permease protein